MKTLGGTLFTHDVLKFDYCLIPALESLLELCDEVVVLDAKSTDGTLEYLREQANDTPKLKVIEGAEWNQGSGFDRLRNLANEAIAHLTTDWHFMLQADEVIHEKSFGVIREIVAADGYGYDTFSVRRFNLFGDFDHHVKLDSKAKPCNDAPTRLGRTGVKAILDAESLEPIKWCTSYESRIEVFHYGLVREGKALVDKCIDMQTWWMGTPDHRITAMKKADEEFNPYAIIDRKELVRLSGTHPKFAQKWVAKRRAQKEKFNPHA